MQLAATITWAVWVAVLVILDPLYEHFGGERATDTHFLAVHIPVGVRAGILGWLVYHFMIQHVKG